MFCDKHPTVRLQVVCDVDACGKCYEDSLVTERFPAAPKGPFSGQINLPKFNGYGPKVVTDNLSR